MMRGAVDDIDRWGCGVFVMVMRRWVWWMNCSFEKGPEVVLPLIMVSSAWALFNARSACFHNL
jgi:hypothetical protein